MGFIARTPEVPELDPVELWGILFLLRKLGRKRGQAPFYAFCYAIKLLLRDNVTERRKGKRLACDKHGTSEIYYFFATPITTFGGFPICTEAYY